MERIARALGADDAPLALHRLAETHCAPLSLREIGMPESGLDRAAELAAAQPYPNPRPLERAALRGLLDAAFHGRPPA
ncbi:hypothetical protein SAMN04489708_10414 [Paracidovorax cattleyae]|uniref:Iron-containing alcohol dehydrogenase n=1 Tax=Paracidovorax cattleyae TaxID=80868 RepID=A0A1H0MP67_9BURK|nr:hypothetical protein C8240_18835 [Paracidovorax cattleyae]SDO82239.1 hypothetical protein SAMN04489708_10414 [Paracidovorax cattleyae]